MGKECSWFTALLKAQKESESLAPFWPQTPPCPCGGLRELAERITFCNMIVPFCDKDASDIEAKGFGGVIQNSLFCPKWLKIFMFAAVATWSRRRREMLKESLWTLRQ